MEEETAEFLCKASRLVPSALLQCHYLSKCQLMEKANNIVLPSELFRTSVTCRFCSNVFATGRCNIIVIPKKKAGRKMKKIIRKNEEFPALLNSIEKKLLDKYKKEKDNKLVMRCLVCKKVTCFPLLKPVNPTSEIDKVDEMGTLETKKKKKKRKKKDIYAGLNRSVVSANTPKKNLVSSSKCQKIEESSVKTPLNTPRHENVESTDIPASAVNSASLQHKSMNESSNSVLPLKTKHRKLDLTTPNLTVREQIKKAKLRVAAEKQNEKQRRKMEASIAAKKTKKCNALKNILGAVTSTPSPKPLLKDFFASLK